MPIGHRGGIRDALSLPLSDLKEQIREHQTTPPLNLDKNHEEYFHKRPDPLLHSLNVHQPTAWCGRLSANEKI